MRQVNRHEEELELLFKKFQSIPKNTAIGAPDWQKLKVAKGEIVQWVIFFDPEAADLLHVRIEYHGVQIMPFSGSEWIVGFFSTTPITESMKIDAPPYVLDIYAYNEDDSHPHEYFIHPVMTADKPVKVSEPGFDIKAAWSRLFGGDE